MQHFKKIYERTKTYVSEHLRAQSYANRDLVSAISVPVTSELR